MITIDLRDPRLAEHVKMIQDLKGVGYTDEALQMMYDRQIWKDRKEAKDGAGDDP